MSQIRHDTARILLFIEGDGTEDNPGYKIRMDRLEQDSKRAKEKSGARLVAMWGLATGLAVLAFERAWAHLTGKP